MASYGITLTQLAKYTAMLSAESNQKFTATNQEGFYKRFCAAQDFEEFIREDITIKNIKAIDYNAWKIRIYENQRSSTPLFDSRDTKTKLLVVPFEKENALLMLMGQVLIEENGSINMNHSIEGINYNEWEMLVNEVQRSSTPLFGSRESAKLFVPFEKEDAALFMLMRQGFTKAETTFHMSNTIKAIDYNEWEMRMNEVQRSSTPLCGLQESQVLVVPFEKENAALFMLMGRRVIELEY